MASLRFFHAPAPAEPIPETLSRLKRRVRALEQGRALEAGGGAVPLGLAAIDTHLPAGGLALARIHEVTGDGADAAAAGFLLALMARLMRATPGPVLWCGRHLDLHGPGLARLGIDTRRLILARARDSADILWAMEEGLRSTGLAGVVAELMRPLDLTQSRRLQLAAEAGGTTGFVLRSLTAERASPSAVETRWRVAARPGSASLEGVGVGNTAWQLALERCRGGRTADWMVELDDATGDLALAAAVHDRSARPAQIRLAV
jgi:protein ImuA